MSEFIKIQQEARSRAWEEAKALLDHAAAENRDLTAEESEKYDRINADLDKRSEMIDSFRKTEDRETRAAEAASQYSIPAAPSQSEADVFRSMARGEVRAHEFRTLVPTSGSGVVPDTFFDRVFQVLRNTNPIFETSTVITTAGGNTLQIPNLTAYSTATIKAAGSAIAVSEPTISNINLGAFKYSFLVPISNELIADSGIDLLGLIADISGRAIAYDAGTGLTLGTGTNVPTGLVTASSSAVAGGSGVAGAPTYENLVDLAFSVAGNSRQGYGFHMNASTLAQVRKIKGADNAYIFAPSISVDGRDMLLGQNIYENPAMESGAAKKSIVYGKLDDFIIRQAGGIQVATSGDYAFDQDVTTFRVTWRGDSNVGVSGSLKHFVGGAA